MSAVLALSGHPGRLIAMAAETAADEHPRLDWLLENWRIYQLVGGTAHLRTKMPTWWQSGQSDADKMVSAFDRKDAIATDAAIWDLRDDERSSVLHVHMAAVFLFNRESLEVVYARARVKISAGLYLRKVP